MEPQENLNPLTRLAKRVITHFQKQAIYTPDKNPINMAELRKKCPGMQLLSFEDNKGKTHRFLYKPPAKGAETVMHFGGSELNYNSYGYKTFLGEMHHSNPDKGLVIPIYPGFHDKASKPSERKLKDSVVKIYDAATDFTKMTEFKDELGQPVKLPGIPKIQ